MGATKVKNAADKSNKMKIEKEITLPLCLLLLKYKSTSLKIELRNLRPGNI